VCGRRLSQRTTGICTHDDVLNSQPYCLRQHFERRVSNGNAKLCRMPQIRNAQAKSLERGFELLVDRPLPLRSSHSQPSARDVCFRPTAVVRAR
jgi:hypothetical protein